MLDVCTYLNYAQVKVCRWGRLDPTGIAQELAQLLASITTV